MRRLVIAVVALGALLGAGCAGDDSSSPAVTDTAGSHEHHHGGATTAEAVALQGQPDRPIAGPQGRVPQFVVECKLSHMAPDDPIVYPGQPGRSHLHQFFGNTTTDADSTLETLLEGDTTCDEHTDTAAYWAPALLQDGEVVEPIKSTAYYRPGLGVDPATVQPFPSGLMMIAGDATASGPQPTSIVAWTCGTGALRAPAPPSCPESRTLRMVVTFQDCWDGVNLDTADHRAHLRYSTAGVCPESHPVAIPQLQFTVEYPVWGDPSGLELASGATYTAHADFVNAWDEDALARNVELCFYRDVTCRITSGRV